MGGEGPTLSQAEKKRLAAEKQSADAAAREMERVARAEAAQAAARTQSLTTAAPTSKKELKAQQKARKKQLEEERRSALGGKAVAERKPERSWRAAERRWRPKSGSGRRRLSERWPVVLGVRSVRYHGWYHGTPE